MHRRHGMQQNSPAWPCWRVSPAHLESGHEPGQIRLPGAGSGWHPDWSWPLQAFGSMRRDPTRAHCRRARHPLPDAELPKCLNPTHLDCCIPSRIHVSEQKLVYCKRLPRAENLLRHPPPDLRQRRQVSAAHVLRNVVSASAGGSVSRHHASQRHLPRVSACRNDGVELLEHCRGIRRGKARLDEVTSLKTVHSETEACGSEFVGRANVGRRADESALSRFTADRFIRIALHQH
jgi:hypothetical protein